MIEKIKDILNKNNPIILEIGCYKGQDTKIFLDLFDDIQLYCFEPDQQNIKLFRQYIGNDSRCKLFEIAISHIDGEIIFYQSFGPKDEPLGDLGYFERKASGSIRKPTFHLKAHPWCKFNNGMKVLSLKLDTWCKQNHIDQIDLIWADVNGAEFDMITGATTTLMKTRYLYTEFTLGQELYEGGLNKLHLLRLLPNFKEVFIHENNILLKNKDFE